MSTASIAIRVTQAGGITGNVALAEFRTDASAGAMLLELSAMSSNAQAVYPQLVRPVLPGVSPVASARTSFLRDDPANPPCAAYVVTRWVRPPTFSAPTGFVATHRRASVASALGVGVIWSFPRGIPIRPSYPLVFSVVNGVSWSCDLNAVIEE